VPPHTDLGAPATFGVPAPRIVASFDPEPGREQTRGWLAVGSFLLLVATLGIVLGAVAGGLRTWQEMQGVAASVLPAVLGVVSSTLGFYFGARTREDRR
jgi:hypothetical protein